LLLDKEISKVRLVGFEPTTYGLGINEPIDVTTDGQPLTQTQDSRGSTEGSNSSEPVATDELLTELTEDTEDAQFLRLEPGLRFVVQRPDLSEGDQRAILAIVRRANQKAGTVMVEQSG
jgi:hypothetical protein